MATRIVKVSARKGPRGLTVPNRVGAVSSSVLAASLGAA